MTPTTVWPHEFENQPEFHSYTEQEAVAPDAPVYPSEASIREATRILAASHQHEFTYLLNNNHTALRGCKCGLAFVGLMAGSVQDLQWHQIHEVEE